MIRNIILILIITPLLSGCFGRSVRNTVQEVQVPLLYCPAPPELVRPVLPIHLMTTDQLKNEGEVVKHYKATVRSLIGYTDELEQALKSYEDANTAYDDLRKQFEQELNK